MDNLLHVSPDNGQKMCPKGKVVVQNSLQERTEIEALGEKCEISIKISTDTCTVVSRKYASLFCMLAPGKTGEGAYARDSDISA